MCSEPTLVVLDCVYLCQHVSVIGMNLKVCFHACVCQGVFGGYDMCKIMQEEDVVSV